MPTTVGSLSPGDAFKLDECVYVVVTQKHSRSMCQLVMGDGRHSTRSFDKHLHVEPGRIEFIKGK